MTLFYSQPETLVDSALLQSTYRSNFNTQYLNNGQIMGTVSTGIKQNAEELWSRTSKTVKCHFIYMR